MSWPPISMAPASRSANRMSRRVSVDLPPPEWPTSPTFSPGAICSVKLSNRAGRLGYANRTALKWTDASRGSNGTTGLVSTIAGRLEQELGELRGVGERTLELAIDPVELPHH